MNLPDPHNLPKANLVAALLAVNPQGLGGVWVRALHGPGADVLAEPLRRLPGPIARIVPSVDDVALFGGVDLTESLVSGRVVQSPGLLSQARLAWITRADAMEPGRLLRLMGACDRRTPVIVWDEGAQDDPLPPHGVLDRLAFFLDESDASATGMALADDAIHTARDRLKHTTVSDEAVVALAAAAGQLGIPGLRPVLLAVEALRTLAAIFDKAAPESALAGLASALVFGHRQAPALEEDAPRTSQPKDSEPRDSDSPDDQADNGPLELVIDAVRTALPSDVLASLTDRKLRADARGAGSVQRSALRGRPLPSRPGRIDTRARIDVLATLTAAAPWQSLRGGRLGATSIRPADIRVRRFDEPSQRLILFLVDASGSAAMARLAEGKGAVETLLSRAYASRDEVAMIAFRDNDAELVLPPTRALARAKRSLRGLPAGGATPLAKALFKGLDMARRAQSSGQSPHIVLISDGRGNRALDGLPDRAKAASESDALARQFAATGVPVTLLDTGMRPSRAIDNLSAALGTKAVVLTRGPRATLAETLVSELAP